MNKLKISALALIVAAWGMPVQAQTVQSLSREVDEMREELQILQRKIYRETTSNDIPTATSSSVQVRLSQFEEQVRDLVGRMDEFDYKLKQIDERFKVMNQDIDVRFKMLEGNRLITPDWARPRQRRRSMMRRLPKVRRRQLPEKA